MPNDSADTRPSPDSCSQPTETCERCGQEIAEREITDKAATNAWLCLQCRAAEESCGCGD